MKKRLLHGTGIIALAVLVGLLVWQGSFSISISGRTSATQTFVLWAISTLIFLLTVTLAFMLCRTGVKLYIERRANREGSRIKTKLVVGALALSIVPVFFLVVFGIHVLNRNLDKWFSRPTASVLGNLSEVSVSFQREVRMKAKAQAAMLAGLAEMSEYATRGSKPAEFTDAFCRERGIDRAWLDLADGTRLDICAPAVFGGGGPIHETAAVAALTPGSASVVVEARLPVDLAAKQTAIDHDVREFDQLARNRKEFRTTYILMMLLISLFVLFVATWIALTLSRQISGPISALIEAANQLRTGNLAHRIRERGIDELGSLIRRFNEMAEELQANRAELERRREFTEAILESIPTGVISLSADRRILRVNRVLSQILPAEKVARARRLEDLLPVEDAREVNYKLNRARRIGLASAQLELKQDRRTLHLAVTIAALEGGDAPGFVIVLEDTSELLRAQKAAAWHEVARRIAHEMKNPLTPIALSAERIARQLERSPGAGEAFAVSGEVVRILRECCRTILAEVQSVKSLVDEFSQFARFPAAQPKPGNLNDAVEAGLAVFQGRLDGIEVIKDLQAGLPEVDVDSEQFKRVVVNLVDNAAEAMQNSSLKRLAIITQSLGESVELVVADSGCGISPEDRERLFLPYFSTKDRGTGLGLAIAHHIVVEHGGEIRVEENQPCGARLIVELPRRRQDAVSATAEARHAASVVSS